jgi:endonuclease YncB( thermonuclease family)
MGWHYKRYSTSKELATFEDNARKNKIGLWVDNNPINPSEWRKSNQN